jgi:hypothetical protein
MWSRPAKQGRSAKRTTAARTRENPEQISKQYLQRHVKITGIPDTQVFGKFVCWIRIGDAMTHRVRFPEGRTLRPCVSHYRRPIPICSSQNLRDQLWRRCMMDFDLLRTTQPGGYSNCERFVCVIANDVFLRAFGDFYEGRFRFN